MQQPCFSFPKAPGCPRWQCARESSVNRYCPSSARYRRLVRRTYSLFTLHYSLKTPGIGGLPKPTLPKGGGLAKPNRGDSTERQFSTWVCSFKKCQLRIPQSRLRRASSLWQGSHFVPGICGLEKSLFARGGNYFLGGQAQKRLPGHRKILPVQGRSELFFGGYYGRHQTGSRQLCGKSKAGAGNKG